MNGMKTVVGVANPFLDDLYQVDSEFVTKHVGKRGSNAVVDEDKFDSIPKLIPGEPKKGLAGALTNGFKVLAHLNPGSTEYKIVGRIGTDPIAGNIEKSLKEYGLSTSYLSKGAGNSGRVNVFVDEEGERTMQCCLGETANISSKTLDPRHFEGADFVIIEGYMLFNGDAFETSVDWADKNGSKIVMDMGCTFIADSCRDRINAKMDAVDVVFGNEEEMTTFTQIESPKEACEAFRQDQTAVVTLGEKGCYVKESGSLTAIHYPAINIAGDAVIDTTGAGDYFLGGVTHGIIHNKPMHTCVAIGNLAASTLIQYQGTNLPKETWSELKQSVAQLEGEKAKVLIKG